MTTLKRRLVRALACDPKHVPHGVRADLVLIVHPGGLIEIRPKRTRKHPTVTFHLARLYARGLGDLFA